MATSYLDLNGLRHLWEKAEESFSPIDTKAEDIYAEGININTESGNPVEIDVPYEQTPSELSVVLEPIQDLNGYDKPWSGGNGKNKWNNVKPTTTIEGVTFTLNDDGSVTVTGTATGYAYYVFSRFNINDLSQTITVSGISDMTNIGWDYIRLYDSNNEIVYTVPSIANTQGNVTVDLSQYPNASYLIAGIKRLSLSACSGVAKPQIELGSSATSFEPYSNICPISGRTEMKVERCGKNLLNKTEATITGGNAIWGGTATTFSGLFILKAGVYTLSCSHNVDGFYVADSSLTNIHVAYNRISTTFDNPKEQALRINFYISNLTQADMESFDYQLELGSTATPYEPYTGETYDITFPTEAGTVYGGTLDMLSGVLTVDRAMIDLGDLTWGRTQGQTSSIVRFGAVIDNPKTMDSSNKLPNIVCSAYETITANQGYLGTKDGVTIANSNGNLYINDSSKSDLSGTDFKTVVSGIQLCYELDTPITYTLTPQQLSLLKGYNRISSDGIITIYYNATSNSTIQNELSEHEEELRNINQSISSLTSYDVIADGSGETTLSGNEISISDAIGGNAISLTANISIGQTTEEAHTVTCGSGTCVVTPLEDPYSSVDIIVKNSINQTKNTVALGTTIGSGSIDIVNGVGIETYKYYSISTFAGKGVTTNTDSYYFSTLNIDMNLRSSCLCNIGTGEYSRILDGTITSPVYGYMNNYPSLFVVAFPKSFGLSTVDLANEFLAQIGGIEFLIPLATPTSFSFTPRNITLFPKNNIITGGRETELLELTYESSTSSNVQIELNKQNVLLNNIINDIAPIEKSIAIENHSVGDYIILNGKFCKVTTAIATGEMITIGVNVSQTTISAEILAILSQ